MDDLERELRATLDELAHGAEPADALLGRARARATQIRHRRIAAVSSLTAAFAAIVVVASVAAASPRGHVAVSSPGATDAPETTTIATSTSVGITSTVPAIRPTVSPPSTMAPPPASTTTTIPPLCGEVVADGPDGDGDPKAQITLLADGSIRVSYAYFSGYANETAYFMLDDGTVSTTGFTRTYAPNEFGVHWYELWFDISGGPCRQRHTFVVDPSVATPDITTTTTAPADSTTTSVPTTSIPATTTSTP